MALATDPRDSSSRSSLHVPAVPFVPGCVELCLSERGLDGTPRRSHDREVTTVQAGVIQCSSAELHWTTSDLNPGERQSGGGAIRRERSWIPVNPDGVWVTVGCE